MGNDDEQVVIVPCPSSSLVSLGGGSRVETAEKNHLQLAFGREGGDGGGRRVETPKITTSTSRLDAREVVVVGEVSEGRKNHLRLAFGCEGGGGGGVTSKLRKDPPPARVWM